MGYNINMRILSMLALVIVLAIVMFNFKNSVSGLVGSDSGKPQSGKVEKQVNESLSKHQDSLDNALKQSN